MKELNSVGIKHLWDRMIQKVVTLLSDKVDIPQNAPAVGDVLKVKSIGDNGTLVCEWTGIKTVTIMQDPENDYYGMVTSGISYAYVRNGVLFVPEGFASLSNGTLVVPTAATVDNGTLTIER